MFSCEFCETSKNNLYKLRLEKTQNIDNLIFTMLYPFYTKSNTTPWAFFTFSKSHEWYQIAQSISFVILKLTSWFSLAHISRRYFNISYVSIAPPMKIWCQYTNFQVSCIIHLQFLCVIYPVWFLIMVITNVFNILSKLP